MRLRALAIASTAAVGLATWVACSFDGTEVRPFDAGADGPRVDAPAPPPPAPPPDAAADAPVVAKGARRLGLAINPAGDNDYYRALVAAREAGVEITNVSLGWDDIEIPPPAPDAGVDASADAAPAGDGGPTFYNPLLHVANLVLPSIPLAASVCVRPVDTNGRHVPADLAAARFDDPAMLTRFNAAQDYVLGQLPDLAIAAYVIGNEIDVPFGDDVPRYAEYKTFFDGAAAHAKTRRPSLKVGASATLAGLVGPRRGELAAINAGSDYVVATYSPVERDWTARDPAVVRRDLAALTALYPNKPIYLREATYPSAPTLASSLERQASFVAALFAAWDEQAARVPVVTLFTMHDHSPAAVAALAFYYGSNDPRFADYLRTVGLRISPGAGGDKPAFATMAAEARRRGF
jgi:hypothetical protein